MVQIQHAVSDEEVIGGGFQVSGNANMENLDFLAFEDEDENGCRVDVLNPSQAAKHIEFEAIA